MKKIFLREHNKIKIVELIEERESIVDRP